MARAASIRRRLPFWTAVCGVLLLLCPYLLSAVSAAAVPLDIIPLEINLETDSGDWVINEIHADPADDLAGDANGDGLSDLQQDEFIELFNNTGDSADISGWSLADGFGIRHQFPEGTIVPDRCAIVVFGGGTPSGEFGSALVQVASSGSLGLDDTGDTITLSSDSITIQSVSYGFEGNEDQSLTRNPDVEGPFERHLTVSAPLETRFSPGTRLDGSIFWGCPGYNAPPSVLATQPANGATDTDINSTIAVTFSEPVSLVEPWYEILCTSSGEHTAVVNGAEDAYLLVPDESFAYSETCQVTLFSEAISDVDGQQMEADMQWQFATEAELDQAPEIIDSYPTDGVSGIPLTPVLSLTFSEAVDLAETAVALSCSSSGDIMLQVSNGPSQFQFLLDTELAPGDLCTLSVNGGGVSDQDLNDPPDRMTADWQIQFSTDVSSLMVINEIDSETPGTDDAEFIELFDGGLGNTSLDGLAVVLFSGHDDSVYASFNLDGLQTDAQGYFLLGSSSVDGVDLVMSDSLLQNGSDAVALYHAEAAAMPVGTAVTTENIVDALVYDTGQETDEGLLPLLLAGELPADENGRDLDDLHSLQRCPNGSGGQRVTSTYWPDLPTPKATNTCIKDDAPLIISTTPADGASNIPLGNELTITFSEEVQTNNGWFQITCEYSGVHNAAVSVDGLQFSLQPLTPFANGEICQVTIKAELISDLDNNDPPDHLDADYSWFFSTVPATHMIINEVDADTEGIDTAEFIELFDGGEGSTALDGLILVLFNGANDLSYLTIDLSEQQTDESGRFVIGNMAVAGVDLILADGTLQNGPDAVALYAAQAGEFASGSAITTTNLLDAVVYGTNDDPDDGLLVLLADGQEQVDEDERDNGPGDSSQRCPDGSGGQRFSDSFLPNLPTPGEANKCTYDAAPFVAATSPVDGALDVPLDASVVITFSEPVDLLDSWAELYCQKTGALAINSSDSGNAVTLKPQESLPNGDTCTLSISADHVLDTDMDDPPDQMAADFDLHFQTIYEADNPPVVSSHTPQANASNVALKSTLSVTFNEPVSLQEESLQLVCSKGGNHDFDVSGGPVTFQFTPDLPLSAGETCSVTLFADKVSDIDDNDPPDLMVGDYSWSFGTVSTPVAQHVFINEVDADTAGIDTAEFIELFDGGEGNTALDSLVVVLYNGSDDLVYAAFDLDGYQTDRQGYFLLGNSAVAGVKQTFSDGTLQNGPDAVALYVGNAGEFPNGTAVSTDNLLDALVYSTGDETATGLLPLLLPDEEIVDEDGSGAKDVHSNQRCPNGTGGQRRTGTYLQNTPTPNAVNFCEFDEPPQVVGHTPPADEMNVILDSNISITFNESVSLHEQSLQLLCTKSGDHGLIVSGGSLTYQFIPVTPLQAGEACAVTLFGDKVSDLDENDPPDLMTGDYSWSFETVSIPVARHMVINEVDADTIGVDEVEFIELFDGGDGNTALDGLEIVLINGADDQVYRRIDLNDQQTDALGYFVIGSQAVPGVDLILPNSTIQNGPDAVALYVSDISQLDETELLDALVYHTNDEPDLGLQFLLLENEPQVNEGTWRDPAVDSNQRCPNGEGGQRVTSGYVQNLPTPGAANQCQIDKPPQIIQVTPTDGAAGVAVDSHLSIRFNEPVQTAESWIDLTCDEGGLIELFSSGGPNLYTVQPASLTPFDSCTAAVDKDKVSDLDGYADPLEEDYVWRFSTGKPLTGICGDEATPIHLIQGNGETSPLVNTAVIIEGVVIGDYQGELKLGGFFLQEEVAAMDSDPLTSEGLFITDGPNTEEVTAGEILRLQGEVAEVDGLTSLVNISSWQRCNTETAVEPQSISLPLNDPLTWEALEGMLVIFTPKLTVIDNERWGSEGIVGLAGERLYYPTMFTDPGPLAQEAVETNSRHQITLDDGSMVDDPLPYPSYIGPGNTLRLGDTAENVTGIVAEADEGYRIQPTKLVNFKRDNPRQVLAPLIPGRTRIAHVNVGGFFNGDGQGLGFTPGLGAQSAVEYERQRTKLVNTILNLDAAIVGLTDIENDDYDEDSAVQNLVSALNAAVGEEDSYQVIEVAGEVQAGFADTAVLIYRQDVISPKGDPLTLSDYPFEELSRRPLAQQFVSIASGQEILLFVAQFPERGNCPDEGDPNANQGDGQACWHKLRAEAAGSLAAWVNEQQTKTGIEALVIGDFNSYAKEDALQVLVEAGLTMVESPESDEIPYSAVFNGQLGTLNHGLITNGLKAKAALVQRWHINADEPPALDYRETNQPLLYTPEAYRSAGQDPLIIDLAADALSAGFSSSSPVWIGDPLYFQNLSHGPQPLTYEWNFGDGSPISNEFEPVHVFEQVGNFTVSLTVETSWGKMAVYSAQVEVLPRRVYLPLVYQDNSL
ncbi:MAG: ExeM/NucH family extracellular endonuclease [Candidatus Promineifilaceae bacterium]